MAPANQLLTLRATTNNNTADAIAVLCGYPLSGPYGTMPRAVLYLFLWASFFSRTSLMILMTWTSVIAVHLSALAYHHDDAAIDLDVFPAYASVLLALIFAPTFAIAARGIKGESRNNIGAFMLWMVLLWTGAVSFTVTQRYFPESHLAHDLQGRNITSLADMSASNLTCQHTSTTQAMRNGQHAVFVTRPSSFYPGHGQTGKWVIAAAVLFFFYEIIGIWLASLGSLFAWMRSRLNDRKKRNDAQRRKYYVQYAAFPFKLSFLGFFIVVCHIEAVCHSFPRMEGNDNIGQWGPQVGFGFFLLAFSLKYLSKKSVEKETPKTAAAGVADATADSKSTKKASPVGGPEQSVSDAQPPPGATEVDGGAVEIPQPPAYSRSASLPGDLEAGHELEYLDLATEPQRPARVHTR